ncbi:flavin-nucleotide-binding protein [Acidovorax sp. HMWF029]|uniref:pyridoxamine 5'-phosphate oxidase family protein n=1 Tax=unclassified Acidovorax TaxID=2684926 RepID=UPI000D3749EC|nr:MULTISPECIES: pyridoxamine 5'-phosphate oxidase family protein [unclassified Acidovorax]MDH4419424.1 pyridoxamine 5'-phosphate oxidase family protein [Acidovorax sp.]PTT21101.1 flavin-nucleotide-binding protein [Acidovorax sp. HMWF029]
MNDNATALPPTDRTRVRRVAENARYDRATLHSIIDAAYLCHVAFADDQGTHNIPTACWREGEHLYIHGSNGGRMVKWLGQGVQACVTITHLDGLVLARSAFNHSMNYRSAMVYGRFEPVADKHAALVALMDHLAVGRQAEIRAGNDKELTATTVLRISLDEAACKVRSGPPEDDANDMSHPVWAGVLPLMQVRGAPVADTRNTAPVPSYVAAWAEQPA